MGTGTMSLDHKIFLCTLQGSSGSQSERDKCRSRTEAPNGLILSLGPNGDWDRQYLGHC